MSNGRVDAAAVEAAYEILRPVVRRTELDLERQRIEERLEELGLVPPLWAT